MRSGGYLGVGGVTYQHNTGYRTPSGIKGIFHTNTAPEVVAFLNKAERLGWVVG